MATYTSNYAWTKPSGNDQVDISVLNDNLDSQDAIMHKAFNNMAQAFSQLSTYAVGDIVLYDNELYKCHTAVTTPGSWTGSTNWTSWTLAEGGGGGGTSDYTDLSNKPSINGVTLTGNKTTSDLGIDKTAVGLGNVPNVATNDQTPTFTEASTRNNIASGEKLSVILGKVQKFFNDLKTVAFSGSYTDLSNKPENPNTFQGTIAEWNALSTAEKKAYDHASIPDSIDGVTFPANKVVMTGGGNVEDAIDEVTSGLNSKIGYNSTTNLDACIESGIYSYLWDSNNAPGGHAGVMLVMPQANKASGVQIARSATVNTIYVRFWDSSTFTAWSQVTLTT